MNRDSTNDKIQGLIDGVEMFKIEMQHLLQISSYKLMLSFNAVNIFRSLNLLLIILINLLIIFETFDIRREEEDVTQRGFVLSQVFGIIQIVLSVLLW